ncbi:hypothetical protein FBQ97_19470, partial [Acidobacteria bacterium ACD]|nr:hypothetical protein [Acidobacteria bacterium ACD]
MPGEGSCGTRTPRGSGRRPRPSPGSSPEPSRRSRRRPPPERQMTVQHSPVSFDSPVVERGAGFFETVLLVGRRAVLWDAHVARLLGTLERFELPAPPPDSVLALARREAAALPASPEEERAMRLAWIAAGADLDDAASWRLDVSIRQIPPATLARRSGARGVTLPPLFQRDTPVAKSTSYFAAVAGLRYARKNGGDEGLFTAPDGSYLEGTSTALVAWNEGELAFTPLPVLPSTMRAAVLQGGGVEKRLLREDLLRGGRKGGGRAPGQREDRVGRGRREL